MISLLLALIYLAFLSLGLPDAALGSAWPTISQAWGEPVSSAGIISVIMTAGTIFCSLQADRLIKKMGVKNMVVVSAFVTAISLLGFGLSKNYLSLCIWSVPYGLGAGGIDSALNNYVAVNFKSKHMSWLHCMWALGATLGPYLMGYSITSSGSWQNGYIILFVLQGSLALTLLILSPVWNSKKIIELEKTNQALYDKDNLECGNDSNTLTNDDATLDADNVVLAPNIDTTDSSKQKEKATPLSQIIKTKGVKTLMFAFFCFCAVESTAGYWASTYLNITHGLSVEMSAYAGALFYLGITLGRVASGFLSIKFSDKVLVRVGSIIMTSGVILLLVPISSSFALVSMALMGLGSSPIYPCTIHSTPSLFGRDKSQSIIGVLMASAYTGVLIMPTLFGYIAEHISMSLFPVFLAVLLVGMFIFNERVNATLLPKPLKI